MRPLSKPLQVAGLAINKHHQLMLGLNAFRGTFLRSVATNPSTKAKKLEPKIITPQLSSGLLEILRGHGIEKILTTPDSFMPELSFPLPSSIREKVVKDSQELIARNNHELFETLKNFSPQEGGGEKIIYLRFPQLPVASNMPPLYVAGFRSASYKRKQQMVSSSFYYLCFTEIMMAIAGFVQKPRSDINTFILQTNRNPQESDKEKNYDGTYHTDEPKPYSEMPNATALFCAKGNGTSTYVLKTSEIKIAEKYRKILCGRFCYKNNIYENFQIYNPDKNELLIDTNIGFDEITPLDCQLEDFKETMTAVLHEVVNSIAYKATLAQGELLAFARQIHARGEDISYIPPLYTSLGITPFVVDSTKEPSENLFRTLFATSYIDAPQPKPLKPQATNTAKKNDNGITNS